MVKTTAETLTTRQLTALAMDAIMGKDQELLEACYRAQEGDQEARAECARIIRGVESNVG